MNDTTYTASVLDAHRADDLRREVALRAQRAERDADAQPRAAAAGASVTHPHRFAWPHRPARQTTSVATR